jgi:hypothetical protein
MKTTFPHDRQQVGERLPKRKRFGADARGRNSAMIEAVPFDVRVAIVAESVVVVLAAYQYSPALALFLYALIGASLVVSVIGE